MFNSLLCGLFMISLSVTVRSSGGPEETGNIERSGDAGASSEREVFDSAIFFTKMTTALTTTTEIYFNSDAPVGPLYNFVVNICKVLLHDFSQSRLSRYFKILSGSLRRLGEGYLMRKLVEKFSKRLRDLSVFRGELLTVPVNRFLNIVTENKPKRHALFSTLNSIYTASLDRRMDDYVYQLKKYGTKRIRHIYIWTRKVFDYVVFYTIRKQDEDVRGDILLKFKLAVVEYVQDNLRNHSSLHLF